MVDQGLVLPGPYSPNVILLDWKGHQRWSTPIPDFQDEQDCISPNGHRLAISTCDRSRYPAKLHIRQYCDAKLLGDVYIHDSWCDLMRITDSGRVWILSMPSNGLRIWAIDGNHAATGMQRLRLPWGGNERLLPTADGADLFLFGPNLIQCFTLRVKGTRVVITPGYTSTRQSYFSVLSTGGCLVGISGKICDTRQLRHGLDRWQLCSLRCEETPVLQCNGVQVRVLIHAGRAGLHRLTAQKSKAKSRATATMFCCSTVPSPEIPVIPPAISAHRSSRPPARATAAGI